MPKKNTVIARYPVGTRVRCIARDETHWGWMTDYLNKVGTVVRNYGVILDSWGVNIPDDGTDVSVAIKIVAVVALDDGDTVNVNQDVLSPL